MFIKCNRALVCVMILSGFIAGCAQFVREDPNSDTKYQGVCCEKIGEDVLKSVM